MDRFTAGARITAPLLLLAAVASAAQWTVGVYMCADNGMNDQAWVDLAEMAAIGSTEEVNIIVQVDNAARDTSPGGKRYRVENGRLVLLSRLGTVDMADTATLADFGRFLARSYPAKNYFLILWDHASGWHEGTAGIDWIFRDESPVFRTMGVAGGELRYALGAIRTALGKRIAVLGFDACLMGMAEVAAEVGDACDHMLASSALVPWGGWPYEPVLSRIVARPTMPPRDFLPLMCDDYLAEYADDDVCISALDMRRFERAMKTAAAVLRDSLDPTAPEFAQARRDVQTFSLDPGHPACPADAHVDFGHLWELAGVERIKAAFDSSVVANRARGAYAEARGAAVWFPDNYLGFKANAGSYRKLVLADSVPWLEFLNCFYGTDDVKPTAPEFTQHRLGGRGDLRLHWSASGDIAPVGYDLFETVSADEAFVDYCEDLSRWSAIGWRTSERHFRSGTRSFFSDSGPNLDNQLVLVEPWQLPEGGLLSFYARFETEEALDSAGRFKRDICYVEHCSGPPWNWLPLDSLYGTEKNWHERRYIIPAAARVYLRLRYVTDQSVHRPGVYVDDIKVFRFGPGRTVVSATPDTSFYLFNLARDRYTYCVVATDSFGNRSMASQFYPVEVATLAEPYTRPAPFAGACELWVDFPLGDTVDVTVRAVSGTVVKRFNRVTEPRIEWDGANAAGKPLADGLYLVTVQGKNTKKLGKIAKVSR